MAQEGVDSPALQSAAPAESKGDVAAAPERNLESSYHTSHKEQEAQERSQSLRSTGQNRVAVFKPGKWQHLPIGALPRTSAEKGCDGPQRNGLSCRYLHDSVGQTCRRRPGGPVPDKWDKYSDFHDVVDLKQLAGKYRYGGSDPEGKVLLQSVTPVLEDSETNSSMSKDVVEREEATAAESERSMSPVEPFQVPNKLMVERLLLIPSKTFLDSCFNSALQNCLPFGPTSLQSRFNRARIRRFASQPKHDAVQDKNSSTGKNAKEGVSQSDVSDGIQTSTLENEASGDGTSTDSCESKVTGTVTRSPPVEHDDYLIDKGRAKLLSVINLCMTERHYELKAPRRDGVSVFFHKVTGGGESVPPESVKTFFRLLAFLTHLGAKSAGRWDNASACAEGSGGRADGKVAGFGSDSSSDCSSVSRFFVWVHCTHGISRTGLMVSALLMALLGFSAEEALDAFAEARGHCINRPEVIAAIKDFQEKGLPEGFVDALMPPKLCRTFAKNAVADGIDLDKGSCLISVQEGEDDASEALMTSIQPPPALVKAIQNLRQSIKQRVTTRKASAESAKGKSGDGDIVGNVEPRFGGQVHADDSYQLALSEEEIDSILPLPEVVPNNGVVLYGPIANDLVAPEELILHILQLDQRIQICDVRILQTQDFNSTMIYPQCIQNKGMVKKRRRSNVRRHRDAHQSQQIPGVSQSEQAEDHSTVEKGTGRLAVEKLGDLVTPQQQEKVDPQGTETPQKLTECRLEYHYILYVQVANSVSFEILLSEGAASLRHQDIQAFPSNYLSYLIGIGLERDAIALQYSRSRFSLGADSRRRMPVDGGVAPPVRPPPCGSVVSSSDHGLRRPFSSRGSLVHAPHIVPCPPPPLPPMGRSHVPPPPSSPEQHTFGRPSLFWGVKGQGPRRQFRPTAFGLGEGPAHGVVPPPPLPNEDEHLLPVPHGPDYPHMLGGSGLPFGSCDKGGPPGRFFEEQGGLPPPPPVGVEGTIPGSPPPPPHPNSVRPPLPDSGLSHGDSACGDDAWRWDRQRRRDWNAPQRSRFKSHGIVASSVSTRQGGFDTTSTSWTTGDQRFGDVGSSVEPLISSGKGIHPSHRFDSWQPQKGPFCEGEERRWQDAPTNLSADHARYAKPEDMGCSQPAGHGSGPTSYLPVHSNHNQMEYRASTQGHSHQPSALAGGVRTEGSLQNISAQETGVSTYHQPQQLNTSEHAQSPIASIPPYVLQLLQQQAALRGSNVEPHILAQLYQQYYQSFLSSMSQHSGGQQLTQEQLMDYLQRMQP